MTIRALTMLNQRGDTTIAWTPDRDAEMEAIIEKKMAEGVTFFIIEPRFGGRTKLDDPKEAMTHRALAVPDEDFSKFCAVAGATTVATPAKKVTTRKKATSAKEVAKSESVGVRPLRGG